MQFRIIVISAGLALCFAILQDPVFGQAGKAGLSFLKLGVSGRGTSMAEAMTAISSGAASTYYNPSGLLNNSGGNGMQLMIMHKEWIQDTRAEFLAASIPLNRENAIGFSVNTTTVSDVEIRTRPGPAEGTFTARNFALSASYAKALSDEVRIGVTAKLLYEKLLIDEASGFAFDVGAQYHTPVEGLRIGAVVANLGSVNELRTEKTTLPSLLRIGPAYTLTAEDIQSDITLATDFLNLFPEGSSYLNIGGELVFDGTIAARTGYQFGSEGRKFSAGIGIYYGIIGLDYAYAPLSADLGNTHTISLVLNFE